MLFVRTKILSGLALCSVSLLAQTATLSPVKVYGKRKFEKKPAVTSEISGTSIPLANKSHHSFEDLGSHLEQLAAVQVQTSGGRGAGLSFLIRGQDPVQNKVFFEGVPLSDQQNGFNDLGHLPQHCLARVDVYPQGSPVFLGADGLGGAIHFRLFPIEEKNDSTFGLRAGSKTYLGTYVDRVKVSPTFQLGAQYFQSNENFVFFDDNGTPFNQADDSWRERANNDVRAVSLVPRIRLYQKGQTFLDYIGLTSFREKGVAGPVSSPSSGRLRNFYQLASLRHTTGGWTNQGYLIWQDSSVRDLDRAEELLRVADDSRSLRVGGKSVYRRAFKDIEWHSMVGAEAESFELAILNQTEQQNWRTRFPFGVSAAASWGRLEIRPAMSAQYVNGGSSLGDAKDYFSLSPRLGLQTKLSSQFKLRGSFGWYERVPSLFELYGNPSGILGNSALEKESALKQSIGFDWVSPKLLPGVQSTKFSYTFGASWSRNLVAFLENSQNNFKAMNVGAARIFYHELETLWKFKWAELGVAWTFMQTENRGELDYQRGKELPRRPRYRGRSLARVFLSRALTLSYQTQLRGPIFSDLANEKRLSSFWLHSLGLGYEEQPFGIFSISIENMTDTKVSTSVFQSAGQSAMDHTTGYRGYPAPGRRVYIQWNYLL